MTLFFTEGHNCVSNWKNVLICTIEYPYLGQSLSYGIQSRHDGSLGHGISARARFDDIDLDSDVVVGRQKATIQC